MTRLLAGWVCDSAKKKPRQLHAGGVEILLTLGPLLRRASTYAYYAYYYRYSGSRQEVEEVRRSEHGSVKPTETERRFNCSTQSLKAQGPLCEKSGCDHHQSQTNSYKKSNHYVIQHAQRNATGRRNGAISHAISMTSGLTDNIRHRGLFSLC